MTTRRDVPAPSPARAPRVDAVADQGRQARPVRAAPSRPGCAQQGEPDPEAVEVSDQPNPLEAAMANAVDALRDLAAQGAAGNTWRAVCEPVANMIERDLDARRGACQPIPDASALAGGNVIDLASRRTPAV